MTARTTKAPAAKAAPAKATPEKAAPATAAEEEPTEEPEPEEERYDGFAQALAAFQRRLPTVAKGNRGTIPGKDGKQGYSYDYADLTDVSEVVLPLLGAVGLSWHAALDTVGNQIVLRWELLHGDSNSGRTGTLPIGSPGANWQNLGSSITYARRYALCAATGVAPGGDDDDAAASVAGMSGHAPAQRQQAPVEVPKAERLPAGLYDLSEMKDLEAVRAVFRKARAAGHLGLLIGVPDASGTVSEMAFGEYLTRAGEALTPAPGEAPDEPPAADDDPEAAERRAVEEYERSLPEATAEADADAMAEQHSDAGDRQ
ncbi:ERF family ssDNA binding protein [Microbacterium phage MementoMori]|uniref:ERF family ssDNA binding protein n=1 Tax=Microbacterium phage MementoMori TaxID=2201436 RepID=A0A2Z4Q5T4_9CAUD|nr:ERF family ssDNA binding protein [Microbacterium phage MementoMori]AWY05300.1 ERF family ssDNA binding protein [Microbacterium phage MementoMori]